MATEIEERRIGLTRAGGPYPPIPNADDNFGVSQATFHQTNEGGPEQDAEHRAGSDPVTLVTRKTARLAKLPIGYCDQ